MDTLIAFGSEIKAVEETEESWKFQGWLIVNDSPDTSGKRDRFTANTQYDFEDGESRPVYYHHGMDPTILKARLGTARLFKKDAGVWVEGEIRKRKDYLAQHVERIARGLQERVEVKGIQAPLFGLSSGAAPHLVERVRDQYGHEIKAWAIAEVTISPTPCEPLTSCVASLKALVEQDTPTGETDALKALESRIEVLEARLPAEAAKPEDDATPDEQLKPNWGAYAAHQMAISGVRLPGNA